MNECFSIMLSSSASSSTRLLVLIRTVLIPSIRSKPTIIMANAVYLFEKSCPVVLSDPASRSISCDFRFDYQWQHRPTRTQLFRTEFQGPNDSLLINGYRNGMSWCSRAVNNDNNKPNGQHTAVVFAPHNKQVLALQSGPICSCAGIRE